AREYEKEASSVASLEQQLSALSPERRRLVELWLRQAAAEDLAQPASTSIPRRRANDPAPLSYTQERFWFLSQLIPSSPAYNLRTVVRMRGRLDVAVLERSLNAIVQRHEVLRTTFVATDGQPEQVIAPTLYVPLPLDDL